MHMGRTVIPCRAGGSKGSYSKIHPLLHKPYFLRRFMTFSLQDSDSDRSFPRELRAGFLGTVSVGNGNAACRAVGWLHQRCSWMSLSGALLPVPPGSHLPSGPRGGQMWQLWASPWQPGSPLTPQSMARAEVAVLRGWGYGTSALSLAAWPSNPRAVPRWRGGHTYCRGSLRRGFPGPACCPF